MNLTKETPLQAGDPGTGQTISQWTTMLFQQPFNVGIVLQAKQSKVTVFTPEGGLPQWSDPYPAGATDLSFEEILALPSADAFFGELFAALNSKLMAQGAEPSQPLPPPVSG